MVQSILAKKIQQGKGVLIMMPILPTPTKYALRAAGAEGGSELNAFDNALLAAHVGNVNLVRVSSILPPGCEYAPDMAFPYGALVPTAFGAITSEVPGELLAAAVGVGIADDGRGVIMEYSARCTAAEAEAAITAMLEEAFAARGFALKEIKLRSAEHRVVKVGCAIAAVPLWY